MNRPDVLLIVLDTLRADRLSCYGYSRDTSPHLDAFAESAVLFERAISPAQWTIPAHASLFTGEYPTTHMMTQIYDQYGDQQVALAELLAEAGYHTVSFCNNPLLGVVENGLDRGFREIYNYGGALPNRPPVSDARPRPFGRLVQRLGRLLRRVTTPLQDLFAHNDALLRLALHPRIVPLWQRHVNFKGNTALSLRDAAGYLRTWHRKSARQPIFTFVNLMETHLPYGPPPRFVRKFAPYYKKDREARDFMQEYNKKHYQWMIPLSEPLTPLQDRVLNDLYDAEVAYEDHLLRHLFEYLDQPEVRENTLVVITSDHGEGLNNHHFVGHSLVAYDDLVRVPLIVRYPDRYPEGKRVGQPASTRRVFHAALEAAGVDPACNGADGASVEVEALSLSRAAGDSDPEAGIVFSEAFTPDTLITLMESNDPQAIDRFRCRSMRRAAYREQYKLITVADQPDELFDVIEDPAEVNNLIVERPDVTADLDRRLGLFLSEAESRRPGNRETAQMCLEDEAELIERLRGLGYID